MVLELIRWTELNRLEENVWDATTDTGTATKNIHLQQSVLEEWPEMSICRSTKFRDAPENTHSCKMWFQSIDQKAFNRNPLKTSFFKRNVFVNHA